MSNVLEILEILLSRSSNVLELLIVIVVILAIILALIVFFLAALAAFIYVTMGKDALVDVLKAAFLWILVAVAIIVALWWSWRHHIEQNLF